MVKSWKEENPITYQKMMLSNKIRKLRRQYNATGDTKYLDELKMLQEEYKELCKQKRKGWGDNMSAKLIYQDFHNSGAIVEREFSNLHGAMFEAYWINKSITGQPIKILDDKEYYLQDMIDYWRAKHW